ncbi:phosphoenolpyruvate carboxykinase (ATP) [Phascolarctobacterium sp.]|uniref:phosphoenolpyruvate carboxykinase (ATP) n=1 Tax=Phascolarctobacterium sp. TaxID=2049039 RepID=UPI00386EFAF2
MALTKLRKEIDAAVQLPVFDLSREELVEEALANGEGVLAANGALRVVTGKRTGRSPKDKFFVDDAVTHDELCWENNLPCSKATFDRLYAKMLAYAADHKMYVTDVYAGADPRYRLPVHFVNELAWQQLFIRNLFISNEEVPADAEGFTVLCMPNVYADPEADGVHSEMFVIINLTEKVVLIGGGRYAGEMKKGIFTVMNYLLPKHGVFSMHCSANVGPKGDTALFFGLSGTGKTTLSADGTRALVGDDEHGWSKDGIFNIEGGCYAKCVHLSEYTEPQIFRAIRKNTVLENVILDENGDPDYDDIALTENTRAAYPLTYIDNALLPSVAGHPKNIIFLTADAFGVLPPVAKLSKEQAMYHYLSGYTSKVAGTEDGIVEPQATFSIGFGEPFLPLPPLTYAKMLGQRIEEYGTNVYLINTGWSAGPYGKGHRIRLQYTRRLVNAVLDGELDNAEWVEFPVFGFKIPAACPDVPSEILNPRNTWEDKAAYDEQLHKLAMLFGKNVTKFHGLITEEILSAGPKA